MQNNIYWKKGILSDTYRVYSEGKQIGELRNKAFSQSSVGEMNGKSYTFKIKGIFKPHTEIIDNVTNTVIGEIAYSNWKTKASLSIHGRKYNWNNDNVWNTKWSINDADKIVMKYKGYSGGGEVETDIHDDLLLLTGVYVINYYRQMTIIIAAAVMVAIIASSQ
ncbi:MAG: hypothetical protein K9I68_01715 [Bacteroidales bacterium]|nr:hypothetical protein [Bacteroidales bacterium]